MRRRREEEEEEEEEKQEVRGGRSKGGGAVGAGERGDGEAGKTQDAGAERVGVEAEEERRVDGGWEWRQAYCVGERVKVESSWGEEVRRAVGESWWVVVTSFRRSRGGHAVL